MKNKREITLSGFILMKESYPEDFEACLVVFNDGQLSVGCWEEPHNIFRQSRGGVIDAGYVYAWLPIEQVTIDLNTWKG